MAMFRLLGNGKLLHQVEHPFDDARTLFLSFDQNHIIKNIRSQFLERELISVDGPVSSKYIKLLFNFQEKEHIKAVRNLTRKHLEPTNIEKMNVARAVKIFSPPVTAAIEFLAKNWSRHPGAEVFLGAEPTVLFLRMIYKWFSILDVSSRDQCFRSRDDNKYHFFDCNDERLEWLANDFLNSLSWMRDLAQPSGVNYLTKETHEALVLCTKSTVACIKHLLENGFHYVLSRNLNSDPIESLFSAVHQMNGGNFAMDVRSTILSLEKILKTGLYISSKHSNVGQQEACSKVILFKNQATKKISVVSNNIPNNIINILDSLSTNHGTPRVTLKLASVAFVAGYIVKLVNESTECSTCVESIGTANCNAPILGLISSQDRGGLFYPNTEFIMVVAVIEKFITDAIKHLPPKSIFKPLYEEMFPKVLHCHVWKCSNLDHVKAASSLICQKLIFIILKNFAKNVTDDCNSRFNFKPLVRKYLTFT